MFASLLGIWFVKPSQVIFLSVVGLSGYALFDANESNERSQKGKG